MKTKKLNLKALVLSLGLAAMMLPAKTLNAQDRSGGLFGTNVPTEQSNAGLLRDGGSGGGGFAIHPQTFFDGENYGYNLHNGTFVDVTPHITPLGSGLFIMAAAGAGYALKKRKDNKKH